MRHKKLLCSALAIPVLLVLSMGTSAQDFTLIDLGTLGGPGGRAWAINEAGTVVGSAKIGNGSYRGFIWHLGVMESIGTLGGSNSFAFGINNEDQVAGRSATGPGTEHAFLWHKGEMTDLGTLGGAASGSIGISDFGEVVGWADNASDHQRAFLYSDDEMVELGTLGGDESTAHDINESGVIVGSSFTIPGNDDFTTVNAFIWSPGAGMQNLGTLGGGLSIATGINAFAQVVGWSHIDNVGAPISHAFVWRNGLMSDLGTLGGTSSAAHAITDGGVVVGQSRTPHSGSEFRAFIYRDGVMTNLNELIPPDIGFDFLEIANDINEAGQIVGLGKINGERRAFLLTPVAIDCNANGIPDDQDIAEGLSPDSNANNVPDECDECLQPHECGAGEVCVDGECIDISEFCPDDDGDGRVTICHIPPGNPENAHTITVSVNAVPAHLAHGDQCGPCEGDNGLLMGGGSDSDQDECSTDLDDSADIGPADLAQLLGAWGQCADVDDPCPADLNADGIINATDLAQLLGAWGPCP